MLIGQFVGQVGIWVQNTAVSWLVFTQTKSAAAVGVVLGATSLPMLIFGMYGGVLADRHDRRQLVMWAQGVLALQALALALTFSNGGHIGIVAALAFVQGVCNAIDLPARRALLFDVTPTNLRATAVGLYAVTLNLSMVVGPGIAAIVISKTSATLCFAITAMGYLALGALIRSMRHGPGEQREETSGEGLIREAFMAVFGDMRLRGVMGGFACVSLVSFNAWVLLPSYATEVLERGVHGYGLLTAAFGTGAVLGGAALSVVGGKRRALETSFAANAVGLGALTMTTNVAFVVAALGVIGGSCVIIAGLVTMELINRVASHVQGRVMALYMTTAIGLKTLGGPLLGVAANVFSVGAGFWICALASLGGVLCVRGGDKVFEEHAQSVYEPQQSSP